MGTWLVALLLLTPMDYQRMAAKVAGALKLRAGERVLVRYDPAYFGELLKPLQQALGGASAVPVEQALEEGLLEKIDVFVRLPLGESGRQLSKSEEATLIRWLGKGGARRELHFHWSEGTRRTDGLPAPHPADFDALYAGALDVDYLALDAAQERAMARFRKGTVRIHTPAGTDLMFRVGARPFNKQNGDASPERARSAQVRVDRHIELPAGALRVAPVEGTVSGQIVLPEARFGDTLARRVVIQLDNGRISGLRAAEGVEAVKAALSSDSAKQFREFALGFNPKLAAPPGSQLVPYYGYGAGVVRLSLGDNEELGGSTRGGFVRWLYLTDASIHVDFHYVVRDGRLVNEAR
jgi:hypothetical protein